MLLPTLGDQYGKVLENKEIQVSFRGGQFWIHYWEQTFPVAPKSYPMILAHQSHLLASNLGRKGRDYREYRRLITAFRKLPARTEKNPKTIQRRMIEKEKAKKDLAALTERSKSVRDFIHSRLRLMNGKKGEKRSFDLLDQFLSAQAYRLCFWRVAAHEINYRRFFNINELAAIRMEEERVFHEHQTLLFKLIREGKVQGVRIDHPDGLYDPPDYLQKIQLTYLKQRVLSKHRPHRPGSSRDAYSNRDGRLERDLDKILKEDEFASQKPLYVVVEKILDRKEELPVNWNVHGTVGYDFLNELTGLYVYRENEKKLSEIYEKFIGHKIDFNQLMYDKKKLFAAFYMTSEVNTLGYLLDRISERDRRFRDFTLNDLITAIREVIACFPVYRTYISPATFEISERDEKYIKIAIEKAKGKHPALSPTVFDFLRDILLLRLNSHVVTPQDERRYRDFILRFQQLTAPIMAKGLEDTAFYIYHRLASLNEVGGDPEHFGFSRGDFHRVNIERSKKWPYGLLSTSTHDTKRSEDIRMRLNVLSEIPEEWDAQLARWTRVNRKHKTSLAAGLAPSKNTEYLIYQTLLGVWPNQPFPNDEARQQFADKIWTYTEKAVREAKIDTSWLNPNAAYEEAVKKFVMAIISPEKENHFSDLFTPFQKKIAEFGMINSVSSIAVKLGSPGVVDTYQGNELWNYRLVDPDNRRSVDYEKRKKNLEQLTAGEKSPEKINSFIAALVRERQNGLLKMFVLTQGLRYRNQHPELFLEADYVPLDVRGEKEGNVVAFLRKRNGKYVMIATGRFFTELNPAEPAWEGNPEIWKDTKIILPRDSGGQYLKDVWTRQGVLVEKNGDEAFITASSIFQRLPVAMLTNEGI